LSGFDPVVGGQVAGNLLNSNRSRVLVRRSYHGAALASGGDAAVRRPPSLVGKAGRFVMKIARDYFLGCFVFFAAASSACQPEVCNGACVSPSVNFKLSTPVAAQTLDVMLDAGGGPIASLHCQQAGGAPSCSLTPASALVGLDAQFDTQGALTSIVAMGSLPGTMRIVIVADGAIAADQTITYAPRRDSPCGCVPETTVVLQGG
jgi:hypothetical protein